MSENQASTSRDSRPAPVPAQNSTEATPAAPTAIYHSIVGLPPEQLWRAQEFVQASAPPREIGPYRVIELISEGGMGTVYKAERRSPMRHIVAIKVIKLGFDTKDVIARFSSERQALARMDHPNIAKVLDAGVTDTGCPYFVMEYVAGVSITKFADDNKLSIKDRLLLFAQVCEAIAHAHTKAIIHRDIKAANVLAYMHDGKPTAKVIDFGIAKALTGDRLTDATFNTERGHAIGTYESMSPEQVDGSPDIDTRTDVYSLGVLLYELLTGAKPFDKATLARAAEEEIRRIIREVEPPRPSTRLTNLGDSATAIAALRREQLDVLAKQLRGELEWIPLKAMRKERDRRYTSVQQIVEDVQNYLAHRPLLAAPESRTYRLRKFLKRNRGPVTAVAIIVLLISLGGAGVAVERVRAERFRIESTRTLAELLGAWNQQAILNKDRGQLPDAEKLLRDGADRSRRELGPDDPISLGLMSNLALVLKKQEQYAESERLNREVLERRRRVLGSDHPDTLYSINNLGGILLTRRQLPEAEPLLREGLEGCRRVLKQEDPLTLTAINNLATLLRLQGKLQEAEPLFREALDRRRRVLGDNHPETLASLYVLGHLLQQQHKDVEAEPLYHELFRRADVAEIPAATAAVYLSDYGACLVRRQRYAEAEQPLLEAYRRLTDTGQRAHPAMREVLKALAVMCEKTNRPSDAAKWRAELSALSAPARPGTSPTAPHE